MDESEFQFMIFIAVVLAVSLWFTFRKKPFTPVLRRRRYKTRPKHNPFTDGTGTPGDGSSGFVDGHHDHGGGDGGGDGGDGGD